MTNYRLEIINNQEKLNLLVERLSSISTLALDIETLQWWDKYRERVALVQIAYRTAGQGIKVAVIDALAQKIDLEAMRLVLESPDIVKAVHNAAFDAGKLFKHFKFKVAPVFDTMAAARRNGERKYSLAAQVLTHLKLHLDKSAQRSDWSRRPLDLKQIDYAACDAYATLLLYDDQISRNLAGNYRPKFHENSAVQGRLELTKPRLQEDALLNISGESEAQTTAGSETPSERLKLAAEAQAVLNVVTKFPDRYSPAKLSVSVGSDRIGFAGWIVDQELGKDADFDEETAQLVVGELIELKLIKLNEFQKLEATDRGNVNLK